MLDGFCRIGDALLLHHAAERAETEPPVRMTIRLGSGFAACKVLEIRQIFGIANALLREALYKRVRLDPVDLEGVQVIDPFGIFLEVTGKPAANQVVVDLLAHMPRGEGEQGEENTPPICREEDYESIA